MLDLLLFHAYRIQDDPREQEIMRPFPPLGLQYLVSWLRAQGWSRVDWFDTTFAEHVESFHERCEAEDPRVVGLYGHTVTRPTALQMVARCVADGRRVIAGGPDPVQYVDAYLDGGVEVIVVGEGELTIEALMNHLAANRWTWRWDQLRKIPGILFRTPEGELVRTAERALIRPLERLPWPHREHRDLEQYFRAWRLRHGVTALSLNTSRGCPYHCTWCSKQVYGDTFRRRTVEAVVEEIGFLRETFDPDQLWFVDDMFTINKRWVHRFAAEMEDQRLTMPFYLIGRPESVDRELLIALKRAGCFRIYFSAESGSQSILDAMRKETNIEDIYRAGRLMHEVGIEMGIFVMLGYPGEGLGEMRDTLRMVDALDPEVTLLSVAHPMKGTQFYDDVADRIEHPKGWEEVHGGRLAFKMTFPHEYYAHFQRHFWTEVGLRRRLRTRQVDRETLKLLIKYPFTRAAFEVLGRLPRTD